MSNIARDKDAAIQETIASGLGELHALGIAEALRIHVALFAGYGSLATISFSRNLKALIDDGTIIKSSPGHVCLSQDRGSRFFARTPLNNAETLDRLHLVLEKVAAGTKAWRICEIMSDGATWSDRKLLSELNLKSATTNSFTKAKSTLRKLRLVDVSKNGLCLADVVFPQGRPCDVTQDDLTVINSKAV